MLHAMIMAGGGGTRFWPRSRQRLPKQFLTLRGDRSLIQLALDRVETLAPTERCWVVTGERYRDQTREHLPALPPDRIVGEPCGRDTAACVGLGAALIQGTDADATVLVTPADHVIEPVQEFRRAVQVAEQIAEEHPSALITFGIPPTYPSTGYGYIHRGPEVAQRMGIPVNRVQQFKEKPSADVAERFVASGEYYWNSGIFVWKASAILGELHRQRPSLHDAVRRIADSWPTPQRDAVLQKEYPALEAVSIDKGVMEHAPEVFVVKAPYQWDDVGSWLALERMHHQDADGNTVLAAHCGLNTTNCVIVAGEGQLVGTIGVSDLLIVQDGNAVLVADRREEGAVKNLVERMKARGLEAYL
jgi:mannose-1-phosphate guanylyltransferase